MWFKNWKKRARELEAQLYSLQQHHSRINEALRDSFPHFQSTCDAEPVPILASTIRDIGREYTNMVVSWEPSVSQIDFVDQNGDTRSIIYDSGDPSVGINGGWTIAETETWEIFEPAPQSECIEFADALSAVLGLAEDKEGDRALLEDALRTGRIRLAAAPPADGVSGQDRKSYSDDQDRDSYI